MSNKPANQTYPSKLDPVPVAQDKCPGDIPAKASPDSVVKKQPTIRPVRLASTQPPSDKFLRIGDYKISTRAGSGYRVLYKTVAHEGNFEASEKVLSSLDPTNHAAAKRLLDKLFVKIDKVEQAMRTDTAWGTHCERKLHKLRQRADAGDKKAQRVIDNELRVKGGVWLGDIKEMISTCNGSSSETADNRNIRKFKDAGLSFMLFPQRPKNGESARVAIFPLKYLDKVRKAIETVYGE